MYKNVFSNHTDFEVLIYLNKYVMCLFTLIYLVKHLLSLRSIQITNP